MNRLIGRPYIEGALGPDAYDCGSLMRLTQLTLFHRELPVMLVDRKGLRTIVETLSLSELRAVWQPRDPRDKPVDGDLVTMVKGTDEHHVGTWLDLENGGVFHAIEGWGVCFDSVAHLKLQGWRRIIFYRWVEA